MADPLDDRDARAWAARRLLQPAEEEEERDARAWVARRLLETPRAEDSLEVTGGAERSAGEQATIEFLRSLGAQLVLVVSSDHFLAVFFVLPSLPKA